FFFSFLLIKDMLTNTTHIMTSFLFKIMIIGADHGGLSLKAALKHEAQAWGVHVIDVGTHDDASVDYPDMAHALVRALAEHQDTTETKDVGILHLKPDVCGVLVCGSGIGMSMAANRTKGVRAALCHNAATAELARRHNNANVLVLGGRLLAKETATEMLRLFMTTPFDAGRHTQRVLKIDRLS
ncbi:MAG: RpiB/LacA/LacB family sugar-phosphate isomerase, partial [Holosporaceae bacterium]